MKLQIVDDHGVVRSTVDDVDKPPFGLVSTNNMGGLRMSYDLTFAVAVAMHDAGIRGTLPDERTKPVAARPGKVLAFDFKESACGGDDVA